MADGAEAMRLVRENLIHLFVAAARADIRRRLTTFCWFFVMVMRTVFKSLLAPLVVIEAVFNSVVWMIRYLVTMADTILGYVDRVG